MSASAARGAWRGRRSAVGGVVLVAVLVAGCSADDPQGEAVPDAPGADAGATSAGGEVQGEETAAAPLPSDHVHGVGINPADGVVQLATHDGLFSYQDGTPVRVGPVIDLMGFTVAGPDHFYASGHPGPGVDLPQPVGLIESTDAGRSWSALSRQGQSDFHALSALQGAVIGFDGQLRASADAQTWATTEAPVQPFALASSPQGTTVLATSQDGPALSRDAGSSWSVLEQAPLLQVAAMADATTIVGITPDGTVAVSQDTGATWTTPGAVSGPPQAVAASRQDGGALQVVAVTSAAVLSSTDGGASFAPLQAAEDS
ncbi:F510_1955 family glycosylhydrolase [uncultured Pseudokineococcus sp.]|uniref:F510_1955 family glycosylhydrolase n=1 Tax=uncultured Pseudokineococcus sp. TaxID=1642928 RepID=UPI00261C1D88|nr:exo-alpha-sialidase [uncultured Pseudokineococcus sp.]